MGYNNNYRDYSKMNGHYSEKKNEQNETIEETTIENPTIENAEEQIVEKNPIVENIVQEPTTIVGVVTDCDLLNVRQRPESDAHILCTIKKGEEIQIEKDATDSDSRFYKITTVSGVNGYCMKQFIELRGE